MRRKEILTKGSRKNSLKLGRDRLKLGPHRIAEVGSTDDDHYAELTHAPKGDSTAYSHTFIPNPNTYINPDNQPSSNGTTTLKRLQEFLQREHCANLTYERKLLVTR